MKAENSNTENQAGGSALLAGVADSTPLNENENLHIFKLFGEIKSDFSSVEDVYHIDGLGDALANGTGLYFVGWRSKVVKTLGDLKELYKFATGKELCPKPGNAR